jgi:hypothetical protein
VPQQNKGENRRPRRIRLQRAGKGRLHAPAGLGRAWLRLRRETAEEHGRSGGLGGESETPAGREVVAARLPPELDDHRPKIRAACALEAALKDALLIGRAQQDDACGIDAELADTGGIKRPRLPLDLGMAGHKDGPAARRLPRQSQQGPGRHGPASRPGGVEFVPGGAAQRAERRGVPHRRMRRRPVPHRRRPKLGQKPRSIHRVHCMF